MKCYLDDQFLIMVKLSLKYTKPLLITSDRHNFEFVANDAKLILPWSPRNICETIFFVKKQKINLQ